jgi:hypothetical protein
LNFVSEVIVLHAAENAKAMISHGPDTRLRYQSRLLATLFLILFVAAAGGTAVALGSMLFRIGSIAGMENGGFAFSVGLPPFDDDGMDNEFIPASSLPVWESTLAALLLAARLLPGLFILWRLRVLFLLYSQGRVFSPSNAQQIRLIAFGLLIYAGVPLLTHGALFLAHMAPTAVKMQIRQVDALVLGLVLFTIARVMAFGHEIERESQEFV